MAAGAPRLRGASGVGARDPRAGSEPIEASTLHHPTVLRGPTALLRARTDERLVALTRRGNHAAYEALVARYQARLLSFCRHMLGSREDAEDVLQEVFANAFNAMLADERAINVRPWLYRIARNRCLNHLRKVQPVGVDTLDDRMADHGRSTADAAHGREDFRELLGDVQELPETQRTALLLREIDALSYDRIAEAMDTTVPSVKSLLVRARVGLAEAAQARAMPCEQVRDELGEAAEGLRRTTSTTRRHVRDCEGCQAFQIHLKRTNRALAAILPVGPWIAVKKLVAHASVPTAAGGAAVGGGAAATAVTGGVVSAGVSALVGKTAAGLAAAAIVTAGAVEVGSVRRAADDAGPARLALAPAGALPTNATLRPPAEPGARTAADAPARSTPPAPVRTAPAATTATTATAPPADGAATASSAAPTTPEAPPTASTTPAPSPPPTTATPPPAPAPTPAPTATVAAPPVATAVVTPPDPTPEPVDADAASEPQASSATTTRERRPRALRRALRRQR